MEYVLLLAGITIGAFFSWYFTWRYFRKTLEAVAEDKRQLLGRISDLEAAIESGQEAAQEIARRRIDLEIIEKGVQHAIRDGTPDFFLRSLNLPPEQFEDYRRRILERKKRKP